MEGENASGFLSGILGIFHFDAPVMEHKFSFELILVSLCIGSAIIFVISFKSNMIAQQYKHVPHIAIALFGFLVRRIHNNLTGDASRFS